MTPSLRGRAVRLAGAAVAAAVVLGAMPAASAPGRAASQEPPVTTVAIVGDSAINPLHVEFRTRNGRDPVYPAGMPTPVRVPLPAADSFDEAMAELAQGPLGAPVSGTLYALAGTRLLIYATPDESPLGTGEDRHHGTATAASAAGSRTGTTPDSLIVFVPGTSAAAYGWLAEQSWIDVASTSVYTIPTTGQCAGAAEARTLHRNGGLLFSSAGNVTDQYEAVSTPNGLPEVYQVGGVDSSGRTWLPPHPEEQSPFLIAGNVIRPYETGARYSFPSASGNSFDATIAFGGTSGASPTVAGYAAELVAEARRLLGHRGPRGQEALADRGKGAAPPKAGPLADGTFTRDELVDLLHRSAVPAETGPQRYLLEGFGATDARSHGLALAVLRGKQPPPTLPEDQQLHDTAEQARTVQADRC